MNQTTQTAFPSDRLQVVDALRGFALLAIVLLHSIEHYNLFFTPLWQPEWLNAFDGYLTDTVWFLLAGKAYATFSLLFGFSFFIQMRNARRRGCDFRLRFAWRLLLLACFAQIHAMFYNGDILLFYAVCGLILIPASSWSDKTIIIVALILLLQPVDWFHMILASVDHNYVNLNDKFVQFAIQAEQVGMHGNFLQTIADNIGNGQLYSNFWQVEAGRICQTPALFLIGMWLGRKEMFIKSAKSLRFWEGVFISCLALFGPLWLINTLIPPVLTNITWQYHFGCALGLPVNFVMMGVLVSGFVLLWFKADERGYGWQRITCGFGRMSLTNYIAQSIIGVTLFYNYGFGLYRYCGSTLSLLLGIVIAAILILWSRYWLAKHRQGPLEYLWKKLTWINMSDQRTSCAGRNT